MTGNNYLLDTNVIIDFFRGKSTLVGKINNGLAPTISSVVLGELYYGAYLAFGNKKHIIEVEEFLEICSVLEINTETSKIFGKNKSQLSKTGKPIAENDIWISASAIQHDTILSTKDKHFDFIKGLKIENW